MMDETQNRSEVIIDSGNYLKSQNDNEVKNVNSGSLGDLSRNDLKTPPSAPTSSTTGHLVSREDSVVSRGSFSSLFKRPFEGSWSSGSIAGIYTPRPEKTIVLFDTVLSALNELHGKYSSLSKIDNVPEQQDYIEICVKLDDRILLIQNLKSYYLSLLEEKQLELNKIESNMKSIMSDKKGKEPTVTDLGEIEAYWKICRELFVVESKLERCTGKLQFQIKKLVFFSKANNQDQYELSIRLNETSKFKSRIKIEKNGYQLWDSRNFTINPTIDDFIHLKFTELKSLNKTITLSERKVPLINNLIKSDLSNFTLWLSPMGTVKVKVIVQWNAILEDSTLNACLTTIEHKFLDHSTKSPDQVFPSNRGLSISQKFHNNRLSTNLESLFRSNRLDNNSRSSSIGNILEEADEDRFSKIAIREKAANVRIEVTSCAEPQVEVRHGKCALTRQEECGDRKIENEEKEQEAQGKIDKKVEVTGERGNEEDIVAVHANRQEKTMGNEGEALLLIKEVNCTETTMENTSVTTTTGITKFSVEECGTGHNIESPVVMDTEEVECENEKDNEGNSFNKLIDNETIVKEKCEEYEATMVEQKVKECETPIVEMRNKVPGITVTDMKVEEGLDTVKDLRNEECDTSMFETKGKEHIVPFMVEVTGEEKQNADHYISSTSVCLEKDLKNKDALATNCNGSRDAIQGNKEEEERGVIDKEIVCSHEISQIECPVVSINENSGAEDGQAEGTITFRNPNTSCNEKDQNDYEIRARQLIDEKRFCTAQSRNLMESSKTDISSFPPLESSMQEAQSVSMCQNNSNVDDQHPQWECDHQLTDVNDAVLMSSNQDQKEECKPTTNG